MMFIRFTKNILINVLRKKPFEPRLCRWVSLQVFPHDALIDETLTIRVSGLSSGQKVTVSASATIERGKKNWDFWSCAHFTVSVDGQLDLRRDASLSGSYTGVEPMGLFWSMNQWQGHLARFIIRDSSLPSIFKLTVYEKHITENDVLNAKAKPLTTTFIRRWYMKPGVKKTEVAEGNIRGNLFLPEIFSKGSKPPAIIDLYGGDGGLTDARAALLASKGFVTLSLAYFRYKDLPVDKRIDLDYFQEAIDWFSSHPKVLTSGIGILGNSFGGTIALYVARHNPKVKAVISINGPPTFVNIPFYHSGRTVEHYYSKRFSMKPIDNTGIYRQLFKLETSKLFDVADSVKAKMLLLVGDDDGFFISGDYKQWFKRMSPQKASDVRVIVYPHTGHLIEPPHTVVGSQCYSLFHKCPMFFGGQKKAHAVAQEQSWLEIQRFFREHLSN